MKYFSISGEALGIHTVQYIDLISYRKGLDNIDTTEVQGVGLTGKKRLGYASCYEIGTKK
jgi:hypothetical protein